MSAVRCDPMLLQGSPLVAKILACGPQCRDSDAPWLTFRGHSKEIVNYHLVLMDPALHPFPPKQMLELKWFVYLRRQRGSSSATQPGSPRITPEKECTAQEHCAKVAKAESLVCPGRGSALQLNFKAPGGGSCNRNAIATSNLQISGRRRGSPPSSLSSPRERCFPLCGWGAVPVSARLPPTPRLCAPLCKCKSLASSLSLQGGKLAWKVVSDRDGTCEATGSSEG